MTPLEFQPTEDTPGVILDKISNEFKFYGKSLPEDVEEFYRPILMWLKSYSEAPLIETKVIFEMEYVNTASSKRLFDVLTLLKEIENTEKGSVKIIWRFFEDDEDLEEAGNDYKDLIGLDIEFDYLEE